MKAWHFLVAWWIIFGGFFTFTIISEYDAGVEYYRNHHPQANLDAFAGRLFSLEK